MPKIKSLRTSADVKTVRESLLKEQTNLDMITSLPIENGKAVLDHNHDTHLVRAVLHRQTNAALGKIENLHKRYLAYWCDLPLPEFLRLCAKYLELNHKHPYYHPGWIREIKSKFNKLNAEKQKEFLLHYGYHRDSTQNSEARKKALTKIVKVKDYEELISSIRKYEN